jgi:hypothetical protein
MMEKKVLSIYSWAWRVAATATLIVVITFGDQAVAQTFEFSTNEFTTRYDTQLKSDGGDTIKTCKGGKERETCTFRDDGFQKSVKAFKEMGMANGNFPLKERMTIEASNGKVAAIELVGDRSTPMGLFHFVGQVGSAIKTLKPGLSDKKVQVILTELGFMRGDDDRTIGEPTTAIEEFAAIRCLSQNSRISLAVTCVIVPRY